jgi:LysM repeat protein
MKHLNFCLGLLGVMLSVSCNSTKLGANKAGSDDSNPYAYEDVAGAMSGTEDFSTGGLASDAASGGAATQYSDYVGGGATDQSYTGGEQAQVAPFSDYGSSTKYTAPSYASSSPKRSVSKPKPVAKKSTPPTRTVAKKKEAPAPRVAKNRPPERQSRQTASSRTQSGKKNKVELVSRDDRRSSKTQKAVYRPEKNAKSAKVTKTVAAKPKSYTIKKGDTLTGISAKTGVPITTLKKKNKLSGSTIQAGKSLNL